MSIGSYRSRMVALSGQALPVTGVPGLTIEIAALFR